MHVSDNNKNGKEGHFYPPPPVCFYRIRAPYFAPHGNCNILQKKREEAFTASSRGGQNTGYLFKDDEHALSAFQREIYSGTHDFCRCSALDHFIAVIIVEMKRNGGFFLPVVVYDIERSAAPVIETADIAIVSGNARQLAEGTLSEKFIPRFIVGAARFTAFSPCAIRPIFAEFMRT